MIQSSHYQLVSHLFNRYDFVNTYNVWSQEPALNLLQSEGALFHSTFSRITVSSKLNFLCIVNILVQLQDLPENYQPSL